jgi:hypothetical protein
MPAPAAKYLWQAKNEQEWDFLYEVWLREWGQVGRCGYLQGEFWMVNEGIKVDERTEMWIEEADEFGMMFLGICEFLLPLISSRFDQDVKRS